MLKVQRNSKGFTLIELLIVIAIIGILAAIAIPAYTGYTRKAKVQEVIHSMGAVKTAVMAYYTETGSGPAVNNATDIKRDLGVDVPIKYLTGENGISVTWDSGNSISTIRCDFGDLIGGDVTGSHVTLTSTGDLKQWDWGGTLPSAYRPK